MGNHKSIWEQKKHFSYCILGKKIFEHNKELAGKLIDSRAGIIHHKLRTGVNKRRMTISNIEDGIGQAKCEIMYSIPDDLVKRLVLGKCVRKDLGVDLQFGSIEIGKKSIFAFEYLSKVALTTCTENSIEFDNNTAK
ncbi:hypothetical protein [Rhabdochromatium marinum]|uniref:hypothetical protein n=1 Tax=Rhabdochromatium marinum TaxID=48729 RepID=UPI001903E314|nr:hypothetical protein [Rhabdochromatium marinum]